MLRLELLALGESDEPSLAACETICQAIEKIDAELERLRAGETVGVYRQHQPQWTSPCMLGNPCEICIAHAARKKQNTPCPLAKPTDPAFTVSAKTALVLIKDGLAAFNESHTAIVLTFSKIGHLRDRSLKIDEAFLIAYATGKKWARNLFDHAWDGKAQAETIVWTPAQMRESRERILQF